MRELHITTAREFENFRQGVYGWGNSLSDQLYVYLDNDIDMNDLGSDNNLKQSPIRSDSDWTRGKHKYYHFDGQNHTIFNIYSYQKDTLFNLLNQFISVKNLTLKDIFCNNKRVVLFDSYTSYGDFLTNTTIDNVKVYGFLFGDEGCFVFGATYNGNNGMYDSSLSYTNNFFGGGLSSLNNEIFSSMFYLEQLSFAPLTIQNNIFRGSFYSSRASFVYILANHWRNTRQYYIRNNIFIVENAYSVSKYDYFLNFLYQFRDSNAAINETIYVQNNACVIKNIKNVTNKFFVPGNSNSPNYQSTNYWNTNCYDENIFTDYENEIHTPEDPTYAPGYPMGCRPDESFNSEPSEHLKDPEYMGLNYNFPF